MKQISTAGKISQSYYFMRNWNSDLISSKSCLWTNAIGQKTRLTSSKSNLELIAIIEPTWGPIYGTFSLSVMGGFDLIMYSQIY